LSACGIRCTIGEHVVFRVVGLQYMFDIFEYVQKSILYVFLSVRMDLRVGFHDVSCEWLIAGRCLK
jgi:hypothetical protein